MQQVVVRTTADGLIESALVSTLEQEERDAIPAFEIDYPKLWERAIAETRARRQPILQVLDGLQASAVALEQMERAQAIEVAKQGLRDITKLDLSACVTYEEMRLMVGAAYYALAAALPADIRQAFAEATK